MIRLEHRQGLESRGRNHFLPFLKIIKTYPFPRPAKCSCLNDKFTEWVHNRITSFTSEIFLNYLDIIEPNPNVDIILIDHNSKKRLQLHITQSKTGSGFSLDNIQTFLSAQQIKSIFIDLICCNATCYNAAFDKDISLLLGRNFTEQERRTKTMLSWIEYFGKEALEMRGGFIAFESNPYVQTQRIHDGLFVQVGNDPSIFHTPEGEALLVKAINALPLLKQ